MKQKLVLTYLLPYHDGVLSALADRGVKCFGGVSQAYPSSLTERLGAQGAIVLALEHLVPDAEKLAVQLDCYRRAEQLEAVIAERERCLTRPIPLDATRRIASLLESLGDKLAHCEILLRALDRLAEDFDVCALVVSQDFFREVRTFVHWAKGRAIPTIHITHGANLGRARSVYAQSLCDLVLLAGRRGGDEFRALGVPAENLVVTGAPAWDCYPALVRAQDQVRLAVRAIYGLPPGVPLVTFAVTTFQMAATLIEVQVAARTLEAFLRAARTALDLGPRFAVAVKDRLFNGHMGRQTVERTARACGMEIIYVDGPPEKLICASDVVVAAESNVILEAILCAIPAINIWSLSSWMDGPYFAAADGILQENYDRPELIAGHLRRLLDDAQFRASTIATQSAAIDDIVYRPDGGAAARCAEVIMSSSL